MKISPFNLYEFLLLFLIVLSSCKKEGEEVVVKNGEIEGIVTFFETNDPLINREVFLYGRRIGGHSSGNVKIAAATTDSNGYYKLNFQFTDKIENLNVWVSSELNEVFSGKDINKYESTEYDLSGYNSCYLQGVIPNTTDVPIEFNTVNQKDIILYPYNIISFTVINDSCNNYNDAVAISIKNAASNEFVVSTTFIGNCDTSNSGSQYIIPPSVVRWEVKKNTATTIHYDTLNPATCNMVDYVIHY